MAVERNSPRERFSTSASSLGRAGRYLFLIPPHHLEAEPVGGALHPANGQDRGAAQQFLVGRRGRTPAPEAGRDAIREPVRAAGAEERQFPRTRPSGARSCPRGGLYASRMAAIRVRLGRDDNQKPAGRRIRTAVANALRRFAPVETGRLRRSIRVTSYGVLIGARYASFTNERGPGGRVGRERHRERAERGEVPGNGGPDRALRAEASGAGSGGAGSGAGPAAKAAAEPRGLVSQPGRSPRRRQSLDLCG